ncbi:Smr/MutS family protein [Mycoplasmopsis felifaucium]|uniref:Smr/MutS family protein n=1 Tax=Mycoplasmopsis felifaucium TaxID=35768 RepID=A0ABZ2RYG9_9BACT
MKRKIIDLHSLTVDQAISAVILAYDEAFEDYCDELQIITGHGSGALKTSIEDWLIKENSSYYEDKQSASFIVNINDDFYDDLYDDKFI